MNEQQFREKLKELVDLAKGQDMYITTEQLSEFFPEESKNEEQRKLLMEYLFSQKISVDDKLDPDDFLSMEDRDYVRDYVQSLSEIKQIEKEELTEIMLSAIAGDESAKEIVTSQFLSQVVDLARLYAGQGVFVEDLIGEGNLALLQGVSALGCLDADEDVYDSVSGFLGSVMMTAMEELINDEAAIKEKEIIKVEDTDDDEK